MAKTLGGGGRGRSISKSFDYGKVDVGNVARGLERYSRIGG